MSNMYQAQECVWGQSKDRKQAFIYYLSIFPKREEAALSPGKEALLFRFTGARYQTQGLTEARHALHQ